jgi:predicted adenylyl cyclase CyaB
MKIEVELRSFITKKQYDDFLLFFSREGSDQGSDIQETVYFQSPIDLRVQKNKAGTKIWAKQGQLHDTAREEIEILCRASDYQSAMTLFEKLGYLPSVTWWRKRQLYLWQNVTVALDDTLNYGYIIELELCVTHHKAAAIKKLLELFRELELEVTPKEEFDQRYKEYVALWQNNQLKKS